MIQHSGTTRPEKGTNVDSTKYSTAPYEQSHCFIFLFVFQTKDHKATYIALSVPEELLCVV